MERIGCFGKLKPKAVDEYIRLHQNFSPELHANLNKLGIRSISIYLHGLDLFSYLEFDGNNWETALQLLDQYPQTQEWSKLMRLLLDEPLPWVIIPEVFHVD